MAIWPLGPIRNAGGVVDPFIGGQSAFVLNDDPTPFQKAKVGFDRLTAREHEVFSLIVNGHGNKSVAQVLKISPRTAEKHRQAVMSKFDTSDLTLLVRYSIALGVPFDPPAY